MVKIHAINGDCMKKIIISSFIIFVVLASYFFLPSNHEKKMRTALALFNNSEYSAVQELICHLEKKNSNFQSSHYKGFIALANHDLHTASSFFQESLYVPHGDEEMLDILAGRACCSYFLNHWEEMDYFLKLAEKINPSYQTTSFLRSLYCYKRKDYDQFLNLAYVEKEQSKNWSQKIIEKNFPSSWVEIHQAHALIERAQFDQARALLEKYLDVSLDTSYPTGEESAFYLAYSYLKESKSIAINDRDSFLKIALFYLRRSGNSLGKHLEIAQEFIDEFSQSFERDHCYYLTFLQFLEKQGEMQCMESAISSMILKIPEKKLPLNKCKILALEFSDKQFYSIFLEKLILAFESALKEKNDNSLLYWKCIETLSVSVDAHRLFPTIKLLEGKILDCISHENEELVKTSLYLELFQKINSDLQEKNYFASIILGQGMISWRKENEEKKGMNLLKISLEIVDAEKASEFQKDIHDFFISLYVQAQETNSVGKLAFLYDAFQFFNINFKTFVTNSEIANHVADAAYFFSMQNYYKAKLHAHWIMKLDPENQEALRFAGLSSFHLGHYTDALEYLTKLSFLDIEVKEALAMCENYFASETIAHLNFDNRLEIDCDQ